MSAQVIDLADVLARERCGRNFDHTGEDVTASAFTLMKLYFQIENRAARAELLHTARAMAAKDVTPA